MWLKKAKRRPIDRQRQLAAVPRRASEAVAERTATGMRLMIPRPGKMGLFRMPPGAVRSFELDEMGTAVWDLCDGQTNLLEVVRRFARHYGLSMREAEVATTAFLTTLARKQLICLDLPEH